MVSSVSVSVPIWLTLTRMLLATPISMPRRRRTTLVTKISSPTSCTRFPSRLVSNRQPSQSSSARPSSMKLTGLKAAPLAGELITAVTGELGRCGIEGDEEIFAGLVAAPLDGVDQQPHGVLVGGELRGEPTLVALPGTQAAFVKDGLEGVKGLSSPAKALGKARGAGGHHHEFLEVDLRLGMPASIEDVHHRNRHHQRAAGGEVAIERLARRQRGGARGRQGGAQHGIGTQPRFVGRPVEVDEPLVDAPLVSRVGTAQRAGNLLIDVAHRLEDALAAVTAVVAVAQFDGLVGPSGCS